MMQPQQKRAQKWQRIVHFPQHLIYGTVADVGAYKQFLPWCLESNVSEAALDEHGAGELQTEIKVGWKHLESTFKSSVQLTPMKRVHAESEPNEYMEHLSFTWSFAPMGAAKCRLDLELGALRAPRTRPDARVMRSLAPPADFSLRKPEHVLAWELAQDQIISEYVHCFSRRCQALEAASAKPAEPPPREGGG